MSVALREWRARFARPVPFAIMAAAAVVLAILGPFGTDERLGTAARLGYLFAMVLGTYGVGLLVNLVGGRIVPRDWPLLARVGAVGAISGLGILPVIIGLNAAVFAFIPTLAELPPFLLQVTIIAMSLTLVFQLLAQSGSASDPAPDPAPEANAGPALLNRLPLDKRGALLSLSSEDHYTRIRTARGQEMVLLRLADAIREAAPVAGLQVHRSHWVAIAAVTAAERRGDGARLTLSDGTEIPVSRTNVPALREAGLLPR